VNNESNATIERRTRQRFSLRLGFRFTVSKGGPGSFQGQGEVVNISSNGVAFRTDTAITPGVGIDASIEWPAVLNGDCVLRLTMEGRVVRVENGLAVMSVFRHDFRTDGRVGMAARSDLAALKGERWEPIGGGLSSVRIEGGARRRQRPTGDQGAFGLSAAFCLRAVSNSEQPRTESPNRVRVLATDRCYGATL
jgi:hypothetical protein